MTSALKSCWSETLPHRFSPVARELNQLFDHYLGSGHVTALCAPASVWEEQDRWCIEIDLPGVQRDNIDITVEKNALRLTAERSALQNEFTFAHQERAFGQIQRVFRLPETVDTEAIEAELKDGVLRVRLSKKPESQAKKIQVKL
jgi:HSP20 family protein